MTTAAQVLAVARTQLGRYYPGVSPYGQWYGAHVGALATYAAGQFCAMGVSWCAAQVGALDIIPAHAYTPSGAAWFKARGRWHQGRAGARAGDLVYFDFPGPPDRISHVGLVESVNSDGSLNTVEFNTSAVVNGDQRNGRAVARKRRAAYIVGYGRPAYTTTPTPTQPAPTQVADTDDEETLIMAGYPHILRGNDNDVWTVVLSPSKRYDLVLPQAGPERDKQRKGLVALYGEPQTIGDENARRARAKIG